VAEVGVDRFDAVRRAWIARHQGESRIQQRRAEVLDRAIRDRQRIITAAVPSPHDDTVLPHLWWRPAKAAFSTFENIAVVAAAIVAPVGWPAGWALSRAVTRLIPGTLRSYPIAALLSIGAALGGLIVLIMTFIDPGDSLRHIVVPPWICVQLAAAPFIAGVYGILEGWVAVPGSEQWWPLTPATPAVSPDTAVDILGPLDTTGPGLVDAAPLLDPSDPRR
jgi:hypothetical protein